MTKNALPARDSKTAKRKAPAYAKRWLRARQAGKSPSGPLLVARYWPTRKPSDEWPWPWTVVIPANEDPSTYDLSICAGLGCIISCRSTDVGNAVLMSLIEAAKPAVAAVLVDGHFHCWIPR